MPDAARVHPDDRIRGDFVRLRHSFTPAQNPGDGHTTLGNAVGMLAGDHFSAPAAAWAAVPEGSCSRSAQYDR